MAIDLYSLLLLIAAFTAPLILLRFSFFAKQRRQLLHKPNFPMPPGNTGLPLIGESLKLISAYKSSNPEPFISNRVKLYGRIFTTHVFGEKTVFSADPDFNRLILTGKARLVEQSYPSSICSLLGEHSLLLMRGGLHKRLHSLTLTRLASPAAIRDGKLLEQIDWMVRETMGEWGEKVLLLDQAKKITFDLSVKQLVSIGPGEWTEGLRREYVRLIDGFFSVPLPAFLSFTTYGRAIKARKKVAEALREVIRKKITEKKTRQESPSTNNYFKKDMIEELLDVESGSVLSEDQMIDFLLALLVAGYETTSTIIVLSVKYLTENPSALNLLREEHDKIRSSKKDRDEPLDWADYKSMPFTQCVINETLRIANIVSGVFRRAVADIDFKGHTIPKGCKIFASFRAVHLDPDHYEDASTFDPSRWERNDGQLHQQATAGGVFTPFGGGSRLCPGYELARVVIAVFLHHLVTRFSWEPAEEDRVIFFPTTRTLKGYPIFIHPRDKASRSVTDRK
ncbi:hypothetical protein LUZ60_015316 [Juncus effusus]|nr:hypothetical protein LUZ60_015316 [Juncus effusus]